MKIFSFLIGYGVSVGLGLLVTWSVTKKLYEIESKACGTDLKQLSKLLPELVGVLERILYTSFILAGYKEFIVFWLLVKVGAGWRWQLTPEIIPIKQERERQERNKKEQNRKMERARAARYNIFLIGNALSIIFGALGALIIKYWPK